MTPDNQTIKTQEVALLVNRDGGEVVLLTAFLNKNTALDVVTELLADGINWTMQTKDVFRLANTFTVIRDRGADKKNVTFIVRKTQE